MSERNDKINEFVTSMLEDLVADPMDPEHRLAALLGLQQAWQEDQDTSLEKTFYRLALNSEIMIMRLKISFPRIMA